MTWNQWLDQNLDKQFQEHQDSISPAQRDQLRKEFERRYPITTARDGYGMKGHVTYTNKVTNK